MQTLRFRLLWTAEDCAALFACVAWAGYLKDWPGPAEGERPTAYIGIVGTDECNVNTGIAAQTIQLAAAEMGIGACMIGSFNRTAAREALRVPEELKLQLIIALGRPAETIVLEDIRASESIEYYRDESDVHHVPKIVAADLILGRERE
jgi:nitroreductase